MSTDASRRRADPVDPAAAARATRSELETLMAVTPAIARRLPPGYADAAERYVALLLEANARLNLTRIVTPPEVARLHLLDALAALPLLDDWAPSRIIDLGSGGGVPAIPLALARPGMRVVCVDSVHRKAAAIEDLGAALGLGNVEVVAARAEDVARDPARRERHDLATARALAALPVLLELALPLVAVGGRVLAWKGALGERDPEMRAGATAAAQLGGGRPRIHDPGIPELGGHRFVVTEKRAPTPSRFPRRAGEPSRRPLGG